MLCMCFGGGVVFPSILFGRLQRLGRSTVASSLQPSGAGRQQVRGSSALLLLCLSADGMNLSTIIAALA